MENDFWLNISSKDLNKSRDFFIKLGFKINERHSGPHMVSLLMGSKNVVLNIFPESALKGFMNQTVTNTFQSNEILFSIGANSPAEVDALANKAVAAGGKLYGKPSEKDGWMYGCGFIDIDGHRWNILYMDMTKMPK